MENVLCLKNEAGIGRLWCKAVILFVVKTKIGLEDMHRFLINVFVLVILKLLKLVESLCLVHERGIRIGVVASCRLLLACFEYVLNPLQCNSYQSRIVTSQEIAEWLDASLRD